jgi:hypothetical protein
MACIFYLYLRVTSKIKVGICAQDHLQLKVMARLFPLQRESHAQDDRA